MGIIDELIDIVCQERASDDKTVLYTYSRDASMIMGMPRSQACPLVYLFTLNHTVIILEELAL